MTLSHTDILMTEVKFWLNAILSPLSLTLNFVLFFLIKYKSSKNLENYKKVLYLGMITDFCFAFWNIIAEPVSHPFQPSLINLNKLSLQDVTIIGTVYFVFTRGFPGFLPFPWSAWSFTVSIFLIYFCLVNISVQFLYRYLLICRYGN